MNNKACGRCRRRRSRSQYARNRAAPDGLQWWCDGCRHAYYDGHRGEILAQKRAYYLANREETLARAGWGERHARGAA